MKMIEIIEYKPVGKGYLMGTFSLKLPKAGNMILRNLAFFEKGTQKWISMPSREYEEDGQKKYFPLVTFEKPETLKAFQKETISALELHISANKV